MNLNNIKVTFLAAGASLMLFACNNNTPTPQPQPDVVVNRLIFTGTADTGGDVKIELTDTKLESVLDGNPNYSGAVLPNPPVLPFHTSLITVDMTDLNYYEETVTINCASSSSNKIPLEWRGTVGSFYENTDGLLYVMDLGFPQYLEQQTDDALLDAVIPIPTATLLGVGYYFNTLCTGSDGNEYRVSFYDRTNPYAHGITTTFSVVNGTVEGIIRVHRLGDGHHPYLDILL